MSKPKYQETFVSPFGKDTESDAFKVLDSIRDAHPASKGWKETKGFIEKHSDGKWYAVRVHEKIY